MISQRQLTLEFGGLSKLCLEQALCPCCFVAFVGASLDRFVSQALINVTCASKVPGSSFRSSIQRTVQAMECWLQDFKPGGASWCHKRHPTTLSRAAGNEVGCKSTFSLILCLSLSHLFLSSSFSRLILLPLQVPDTDLWLFAETEITMRKTMLCI